MSDGEDGKRSSPPGWYPYGEERWAWWDGEAFGPFAPRAPSRPPLPDFEPYKPRIGKKATIPLVLLGVVLTIGVVIAVTKLGYFDVQQPVAVGTVSQTEVADTTDGCGRMYAFPKGAQQEAMVTDEELAARLRGLRDATRANDPQLAIGVQELLDAADASMAREIIYVIMSRCLSVGDLTSDQLAEVGVGPATVT